MSARTNGRHRAADVSSASLLIDAVSRNTTPSVKAAAAVVATGGMAASVAIPAVSQAQAVPEIAPVSHAQPAAVAHTTFSQLAVPATVRIALAPVQASFSGLPAYQAKKTAEARAAARKAAAAKLAKKKAAAAAAAKKKAAAAELAKRKAAAAKAAAKKKAADKRLAAKKKAAAAKRAAERRNLRTATKVARTSTRQAAAAVRSTSRQSVSVSRSTVRKAVTQSTTQATGGVLGIAASLTGIYYVYGGTTPAGFDCSGYTSYVFRKAGINLPRTAAAQQAAATRVSDPQPGDLVFFGYPAHHVGIYAGNGMMYHSPRTGKATQLAKVYSKNVTYGRP